MVGEVGDAAALLGAVQVTRPNAAIVDIRMPPTHTDEGLILSQYVEPHYAIRLLEDHPERVGYLIAEGLSNRAIAARLFVTERTVEAHVTQIFQKLSLNADASSHRRVLAVLAYLRRPG
jgi:DNA-binding NarL/FixJ family response regulator